MSRSWRRAALVVGLGWALAAAAMPAGAAECAPGEGTTVVVDSTALGGSVAVGCAPTATTGFEALAQAGFTVTPLQSNPAFVCRIDGRPGEDTEDCVDTPPASAFWSYWTADRGGSWTFNSRGASSAIPGDLEGWAFAAGSTNPPAFAVPPAPTTTTTSATTTSTTTSSTTTTATTTTTTTTPPTTTSTSSSTTTTSSTATTSSTSTSITTTTAPTTTPPTTWTTVTPAPTSSVAAPTTLSAAGDGGRGGAAGFAAGMGAVALLAGAAVLVARRRSVEEERE